MLRHGIQKLLPRNQATSRLINSACLLTRLTDNGLTQEATQEDERFCGWIVDSIPYAVLQFFDHSALSLARLLHDLELTVKFSHWTVKLESRELGRPVLEQADIREYLLERRTMILREAVSSAFQLAFGVIKALDCISSTAASEHQLYDQAFKHR